MGNTRKCLREVIKYSLFQKGFNVTNQGSYIKAERGKEKYRILPVTRTIPIDTETSTVEANKDTVKKFQKGSKPNFVDCIAYGIGKVSGEEIKGIEVFIISIEEFEKHVQPDHKTGDILSRASNHYHYNYEKYRPINELLHVSLTTK